MTKKRPGQELWIEWEVNSFSELKDPASFYTYDWVDFDNEVVFKALAYSVQRSGIADSLREAFEMIETAEVRMGFLYRKKDDEEILWQPSEFFDWIEDVEDVREVTMVEFEIGN